MTDSASLIFIDTGYVLALISVRDQWHEVAARWEERIAALRQPLLTTEFVLVEIGDALANGRFRQQVTDVIDILRSDESIEIVQASSALFDEAFGLYRARRDKSWSLTDCASFVVMYERGLYAALTNDEHFRQAMLRALLLEE